MRKIILSFVVLGLLLSSNFLSKEAFTQSIGLNDISVIEERLFNQSYNQEDIDSRLSKIEQIVYGKSFNSHSVEQRINKIRKILPVNNQVNYPVLPEKGQINTIASDFNSIPGLLSEINSQDIKATLPPHKEQVLKTLNMENKGNSVNGSYPVIDKAEKHLLGELYSDDSIYNRLDRLELKINGVKSQENLYNRVENISNKLNLGRVKTLEINQKKNFFSNNSHNRSNVDVQRGNDYYKAYDLMGGRLGKAELKVFGKSYEGDICLNRIDRLEKKVFNNVSFGLIEDRLNKIEARLDNKDLGLTSGHGNKGINNNKKTKRRQKASKNNMNVVLNNLENRYLGTSYNGLDPQVRVNQLESMLFGRINNGNINYRINNLVKAAMAKKVPVNVVNNLANTNSLSRQNFVKSAANNAVDKAIGNKGSLLGDIGKSFGQTMIQNYNQNY